MSTLSKRMRLPIDGPLMGPLMTIGEWTVNAWAEEVSALETEVKELRTSLNYMNGGRWTQMEIDAAHWRGQEMAKELRSITQDDE